MHLEIRENLFTMNGGVLLYHLMTMGNNHRVKLSALRTSPMDNLIIDQLQYDSIDDNITIEILYDIVASEITPNNI